jgi:hypothetical protein
MELVKASDLYRAQQRMAAYRAEMERLNAIVKAQKKALAAWEKMHDEAVSRGHTANLWLALLWDRAMDLTRQAKMAGRPASGTGAVPRSGLADGPAPEGGDAQNTLSGSSND